MDSPAPPLPGGALRWAEHRSAHLVLRFPVASAAERDAPSLATRLESIRDALARTLELGADAEKPIQVSLGEASPPVPDGEVRVADGQILAVYRTDGPGKGLDRALVEVVLTAAGLQARRAPALVDGLLGRVTQEVDGLDRRAIDAALLAERRRGTPPPLAGVLATAPTADRSPAYYQVVTSFVSFLVDSGGPARFKDFARGFDAGDPDRAAE